MIARALTLIYGLFACMAGLIVFLYLVGFVGNRYTFSSVDSGLQIPPWEAARFNLALLALFAAQHSLMSRRWWKRWSRKLIPEAAERATYVLATSFVLLVIYVRWEPMPELVWDLERSWAAHPIHALFWAGWLLAGFSAASMGALHLLGVQPSPRTPFRTPGPYLHVRHPMMLGLLLAFWSTPVMTQGHLLFAAGQTVYVVLALRWEERDLEREHGEAYRLYKSRVPRLIPGMKVVASE